MPMDDMAEFEDAIPRVSEPLGHAIEVAQRLLGGLAEGVGQGMTPDGHPCVAVMVDHLTPDLEERIPSEIEGFPVQIIEAGTFHAGG